MRNIAIVFLTLGCRFYYALRAPTTPAWAKAVLGSALIYFLSPIDLMPDFVPGVGFVDDIAVIAAAIIAVSKQIDASIKEKAARKVESWLGKKY